MKLNYLRFTAIALAAALFSSCMQEMEQEDILSDVKLASSEVNETATSSHYYWSGGEKIWLDIDSTLMIAKFDSEESLKTFISSASSAMRMPTQSPLAIVPADKRLDAEKTIASKTFAHKFHKSESPFYLTGDILLKPKEEGIPVGDMLEKLGIDGQIIKKYSSGTVVVRLKNWDNFLDAANTIHESGMVEWCHPDFAAIIERTFIPADPMFNQQYYLRNTGQALGTPGIDINVVPAWDIATSSSAIRVAVIDDGVENHEDLGGRILQGFTPLTPNSGFGAPTTLAVPNNITIGHGQACAGIIAASHNTIGIAGVAPNIRIVPVNIFHSWDWIHGGWMETVDHIVDAINFAWDLTRGNADVISNSWGYNTPQVIATAIETEIIRATVEGRMFWNGISKGCVVVFSSGNYHQSFSGVTFPANVPRVLTVGAINRSGTVWNYSSRGNELDVVAPSGNINNNGDVVTTDRMGAPGYVAGNYVTTFGGTSAAAPQVSGIAALILSANPDMTNDYVRFLIESTATKLRGYSFNVSRPSGTWNSDVGYGMANAAEALVAAGYGYRVTFETNGATAYFPAAQYAAPSGFVTKPSPDPFRAGYFLQGWYDNIYLSGSPVNFASYPINSNKTFYAKWGQSPGFDFVIRNYSPYDLENVDISFSGKIGGSSTFTPLIYKEIGTLVSGGSLGHLPYWNPIQGFDLTQPPGTAINNLNLLISTYTRVNGTVTVRASLDGGTPLAYQSFNLSSSVYVNQMSLQFNTGTTVPTGRNVLNIVIDY